MQLHQRKVMNCICMFKQPYSLVIHATVRYSRLFRFLAPHQREVVRLLQFSAQASHDLVPPDAVEPVLK